MGYTRYWNNAPKIHKDAPWKAFVEDFKKLKETLPDDIEIRDKSTDLQVYFNGVGKEAHETFCIKKVNQGDGFDFCKTARKSYDTLVAATLLIYKHHFPQIELSADGSNGDDGAMLIATALPYGVELLTEMAI